MSWGRKPRTPEICFLGPVAVLALLAAAAAVRCCAAEGTVAAVQSAPQPNPRGYASLDLSKGGVQSDLADLKPRAKIVIGGRTIDVTRLPAGLKYFADLGVIAPAWLDSLPMRVTTSPAMPSGRHRPAASGQLTNGRRCAGYPTAEWCVAARNEPPNRVASRRRHRPARKCR